MGMKNMNDMVMEYSRRDRLYHRYKALATTFKVIGGLGFFILLGVGGGIDYESYGGPVRELRYYLVMGLVGLLFMAVGYIGSGLSEKEMGLNQRWMRRFNTKVRYRGISRIML